MAYATLFGCAAPLQNSLPIPGERHNLIAKLSHRLDWLGKRIQLTPNHNPIQRVL